MRKELRTEGKPGATPDEVSVRVPMHEYYIEFLKRIPPKSSEKEERFRNGLQCVVWGFFYVEAFTNFACELTVLRCSRVGRVAKDLWLLSEKTKIASKITFLASVYQVDKTSHEHIRQMVERLGKMRNRLAHYKDEPTIVEAWRLDKPLPKGQSLWDALPDPQIVNDVLSMGIERCRKEVLEIGDWLGKLLRNPPEDLSNGKTH